MISYSKSTMLGYMQKRDSWQCHTCSWNLWWGNSPRDTLRNSTYTEQCQLHELTIIVHIHRSIPHSSPAIKTPRNKAPLCNQDENLNTQCQSSHFYRPPQWPHCTHVTLQVTTPTSPFPTLSSHTKPAYRHAEHTVQYEVNQIWHQRLKHSLIPGIFPYA